MNKGVLQFRNFYEDKKKIRESRDMIAFNKPDPAVRNDTSYSSTDSTREMLITRYRNGKVNEFRKYITLLKDDKVWFWIYMNADGSISVYDKFVMTAEGKEKSRWQAFADNPLDLKKDPNLWEKYNEHVHLMLSVYNMKNGVKKISGRKYEYDEHNNAVWIQFTEWNAASNTYEPVRENHRGRGLARDLVSFVESFALSPVVESLFLLTTTAEAFFVALGYGPASRQAAPQVIQATPEFSGLCPSSSAFLSKRLGRANPADHGDSTPEAPAAEPRS